MSEYLKREDVRRAALHYTGDALIAKLDELPVKEIVHCRECKRFGAPIFIDQEPAEGSGYCGFLWVNTQKDDFCKWGRRKDATDDD